MTFRANYPASPTRDTRENKAWLRGYVGHSMRVATAPGVVMSTNVISVGANTLERNAKLPQLGTMGEIER